MTEPNASKKPKRNNKINGYIRYSGIAIQMLVIIGLGSYGGVKLDEAYPNKYSLFTIVCSLLSVGIAMYIVVRQANRISNEEDE